MRQDPGNECVLRAATTFAMTHWSVVLAARDTDSEEGADALARLCQAHWYPLYAFLRRRGYGPEDAQDLTQGFFAQLVEKEFLRVVDPQKGRFRAFLMMALERFAAKERVRSQRLKRGGGPLLVSLDEQWGEQRYRSEPVEGVTPEKLFERRWTLTMLDRALERLQAECASAGRQKLFETIRVILAGDPAETPYERLAAQIGMSTGAFKVAVHRMRQRYAEIVREEVAQTVASPDEVDEEIRHLLATLA